MQLCGAENIPSQRRFKMPAMHKVTYSDEITLTEAQANFIAEFCPQHGQMGQAGAFYVNAEVLEELREVASQLIAHK
jgi:hypothetical protein